VRAFARVWVSFLSLSKLGTNNHLFHKRYVSMKWTFYRCMRRASSYNMYIKQQDAQNLCMWSNKMHNVVLMSKF
jgi:hypothetical protein